jgi:iron complex transport system substrate-binding protein
MTRVEYTIMRVASLIASSTEIACALGCRDLLVGRSHECDFPPDVSSLPVLTEPKFPVDGSSAQIDERVKEILRSALSVYRVKPELLDQVRPDVILTQEQCEVCAVSTRDVEEAVCQLVSSRPRIVALEPNGLPDVWRDVRKVAEALGVHDRGEALIASLQTRMQAVSTRVAGRPRPTIACIEWIEPLMSAGNWMPTLCELAGGVSLFGEAGKHSPWMTFDELRARDPEVIVVLPCGFDIPRTLKEMPLLAAQPGWRALRAMRNGRVAVADGNQYFNRPGPRLAESVEILGEILHPGTIDHGHRGRGWVQYEG